MQKISANKYYLNIHHRSVAIKTDKSSITIDPSFSPGHFYVSLQQNDKKKFFGMYPEGKKMLKQLFGKEVIKSEEEEEYTKRLKKLEAKTGKEYHSVKSIILTEEQYGLALDYAMSKTVKEAKSENYIVAINDCTDFVQQIYHEAGLPLYFTTAFTRNDLIKIGSAAALNVLNKYGAMDCLKLTFNAIKSTSKKALANALNIDVSKVCLNSPDLDLDPSELVRFSFKILTDQIKLPKIINIEQRPSKHNNQHNQYTQQSQQSQQDDKQHINTDTDIDFSSIIKSFSLTKEQKKQATNDAQDFFSNMMSKSYMSNSTTLNNFIPTQKDLFPEQKQNKETEEWVNDIFGSSERILNNTSFNDTPKQSNNQNSSEELYSSISNSVDLIGKIFDATNINDDTELD